MAIINRSANRILLLFTLLTLATTPARASLFSLAATGTISVNSSGDPTIPIGTPWSFELTYDTAAPDLDPDPTNGSFANTAAPPALTFFHYRAGGYEVTIDDPADFGTFSGIFITFTSVNAMDINIDAPAFFPSLAGGAVSFHADFNRFATPPIFSSDALPTNTALGPDSFDESTVSLLSPNSVVSGGGVTSLTLVAALPGDFNIDGVVDAADYTVWRDSLGSTMSLPNDDTPGVGQDDYARWKAHFGQTAGVGARTRTNTAVPEPGTGIVLLIGMAAVLVARRVLVSKLNTT